MAGWQIGAAISLGAVESLKCLWGTAVSVINTFCKDGVQLAAVTYMANCSVIAGDSVGWSNCLRLFAEMRKLDGFSIGSLRLGFPGNNLIPLLLESEFGTRWLGILCIASFMTNEQIAAEEIHALLSSVARQETAQYILDYDQCERMWALSREIFAGSPMLNEFQRITLECTKKFPALQKSKNLGISGSFNSTMNAAFRIWELANTDPIAGARPWLKGSVGFGHMIFYLTAVCGFSLEVVTGTDDKLIFGSNLAAVTVVMSFDSQSVQWETGYILEDDATIEESVAHLMTTSRPSGKWSPGRARFAPPSSTDDLLKILSQSDEHSQVNLDHFHSLKEDLAHAIVQPSCSYWLACTLHVMAEKVHVLTNEARLGGLELRRNRRHRETFSRQLKSSIELFAPGFMKPNHLHDLIGSVRNGRKPSFILALSHVLRPEAVALLCPDHESHADYFTRDQCIFYELDVNIHELAERIWQCAHLDLLSQKLLRSSTLDSQINSVHIGLSEVVKLSASDHTRILQPNYLFRGLVKPFAEASRKDVGRNTLAIAANGFIIGLNLHENLSIAEDPGYGFYIVPGSIETTDRRFKIVDDFGDEAFDDESDSNKLANSLSIDEARKEVSRRRLGLHELMKPLDAYRDWSFRKTIHPRSSGRVDVKTRLVSESGDVQISLVWTEAIDLALFVMVHNECRNPCVSGRLEQSDIDKVEILCPDNGNVTLIRQGVLNDASLMIVPCSGNSQLQKAVLTTFITEEGAVFLNTECVHCAVKSMLEAKQRLLLL